MLHELTWEEHIIVDGIEMCGSSEFWTRKAREWVKCKAVDDAGGFKEDDKGDESDGPMLKNKGLERHDLRVSALFFFKCEEVR